MSLGYHLTKVSLSHLVTGYLLGLATACLVAGYGQTAILIFLLSIISSTIAYVAGTNLIRYVVDTLLEVR